MHSCTLLTIAVGVAHLSDVASGVASSARDARLHADSEFLEGSLVPSALQQGSKQGLMRREVQPTVARQASPHGRWTPHVKSLQPIPQPGPTWIRKSASEIAGMGLASDMEILRKTKLDRRTGAEAFSYIGKGGRVAAQGQLEEKDAKWSVDPSPTPGVYYYNQYGSSSSTHGNTIPSPSPVAQGAAAGGGEDEGTSSKGVTCIPPFTSTGCETAGGNCQHVFVPSENLCVQCLRDTSIKLTVEMVKILNPPAEWCGCTESAPSPSYNTHRSYGASSSPSGGAAFGAHACDVDIAGKYLHEAVHWTAWQTGCQVVFSSEPPQGEYAGVIEGHVIHVFGPEGSLQGYVYDQTGNLNFPTGPGILAKQAGDTNINTGSCAVNIAGTYLHDKTLWTVAQTGCDVAFSSEPDHGVYTGTIDGHIVRVSGAEGTYDGYVYDDTGNLNFPTGPGILAKQAPPNPLSSAQPSSGSKPESSAAHSTPLEAAEPAHPQDAAESVSPQPDALSKDLDTVKADAASRTLAPSPTAGNAVATTVNSKDTLPADDTNWVDEAVDMSLDDDEKGKVGAAIIFAFILGVVITGLILYLCNFSQKAPSYGDQPVNVHVNVDRNQADAAAQPAHGSAPGEAP